MIYQAWPLTFELKKWPKFLRKYDAYSLGFFIIVKECLSEEYKKQILVHERCHCRQFFRTCGLHPLLYTFSSRYRFNSEIEAFYFQIRSMNSDDLLNYIDIASERIFMDYKLEDKYTKTDVRKALLSRFSIPYVDEETRIW